MPSKRLEFAGSDAERSLEIDGIGSEKRRLAERAGLDPARRAVPRPARVEMDDHIGGKPGRLRKPLSDRLVDRVEPLDVEIARNRQVEVDVLEMPRAPGAKRVQIDPLRSSRRSERFDDRGEPLGLGLVHETTDRDANQSEARPEDVSGDRDGDERIEDLFARHANRDEARHDSDARDHVREDVTAVGLERERVVPATDADEVGAEKAVREGRRDDDRETDVDVADARAAHDRTQGLDHDQHRGDRDAGPLDAGREELDLSVPVGVVAVRRTRGDHEAREEQRCGHDVDDRFERVGEDGRRTRESPRDELSAEDRRTDREREDAGAKPCGLRLRLVGLDPDRHPLRVPRGLRGYTAPVSTLRTHPPELRTSVPGPQSLARASRLARVESRNVTCLAPDAPIFWEHATASNVFDVDGNRYVDLGAGFGVLGVGHAHPRVVEAVARQSASLVHAMGDVYPAAIKVDLLEALAERFPGGGPARAVLGSSGSDAVEAAIETAVLATGRPGVVAFEGAYHGLSIGALDATWRPLFRRPFAARLAERTSFAVWPDAGDVVRAASECRGPVGAVLVEPIQGRGGERIPPEGFLRALRGLCDREGWLLIADEVYTGFGRTGRLFACEHEAVVPDLLCVGKALGGGFPISACIGRAEVMDAWPVSEGEALRTQTFLGHPPACAAALATLAVLDEERLVERAREKGALALARLRSGLSGRKGIVEVRGKGLLIGIELDSPKRTNAAWQRALRRGVITLPSGDLGNVLAITPPLSIDTDILALALDIVMDSIG